MGDSPEKPKTGNVQVLERAFDLLEALAQSREPMGLSALATQTAMSKSTVHRILATMFERDYVTKTLNGTYAIGPKLFSMLSYHINSLELQVEAKPHLAALERELKLPAYLGVLDGPFVSIISKEATNRADELFTRVGKRYPAHCSSMGKCLLACLSADELEETLYGFTFEAHTANTITNKQEFLKYLHGVRRRGWAVDCEESAANHRCLAAPIFDFSGDAIAAVGVSGSNADMPESEFETMAHSVVKAARNISLSMGYVM